MGRIDEKEGFIFTKDKGLRVVSLFDGISCGRVALERAALVANAKSGVCCSRMQPRYTVSSYTAFEIDKYAKSISRYNFPDIEQHGDVMDADFRRYEGADLLIGGSPCQTFSIAKNAKREVEKGGKGWGLFLKFAEAVRLIRPAFFLFENVASMSKSIRDFISEELGCEPVLINSALVSAQHRKRLYWTNIGGGTGITQPADKGILLKDILEAGLAVGAALRTRSDDNGSFKRLEVRADGKLNALTTVQTDSVVCAPIRIGQIGNGGQGERIYSVHGKTVSLAANGGGGGAKTGLYKINLPDGDYAVRKLSTVEVERCQTLCDGYTALGIDEKGNEVKISNQQRYKAIGNGWTVDVIAHILNHMDS